jgi:hypothetical protein
MFKVLDAHLVLNLTAAAAAAAEQAEQLELPSSTAGEALLRALLDFNLSYSYPQSRRVVLWPARVATLVASALNRLPPTPTPIPVQYTDT